MSYHVVITSIFEARISNDEELTLLCSIEEEDLWIILPFTIFAVLWSRTTLCTYAIITIYPSHRRNIPAYLVVFFSRSFSDSLLFVSFALLLAICHVYDVYLYTLFYHQWDYDCNVMMDLLLLFHDLINIILSFSSYNYHYFNISTCY